MSKVTLALVKRLTSIVATAGLLAGCASTSINLTSTPTQSEVYVQPLGRGTPRKAGVTPLKASASELVPETGGAGPVWIELRKDGFNPVRTLVTDLSATDLTLAQELTPLSGLEDQDRMNVLIDRIFEAQRLAMIGRFPEALEQLKKVQGDAPQVAATYELEGGIYFLQKKFKESLDSYRTAAKYNPKNPETIRMRNLLEARLLGDRLPAGGSRK
jgi:hypothetical protein